MAKLLLVEDNELNRDMLSRRLRRRGYEVEIAVDGAEAVAIATDALTVDITMPMRNMAPMTTKVELAPTDAPNQFKVSTFFGMKGDWMLDAMVTDPDQPGAARLVLSVE